MNRTTERTVLLRCMRAEGMTWRTSSALLRVSVDTVARMSRRDMNSTPPEMRRKYPLRPKTLARIMNEDTAAVEREEEPRDVVEEFR